MNHRIAAERLRNQSIAPPRHRTPADVVGWFGAMQAQEYAAARWAIGLRIKRAVSDAIVEQAIDAGAILRTHVLRPTWHFVLREDIRWMLALTAPRVHQAMAFARRYFEADPAMLVKSTSVFERALADRQALTRRELGAALQRAGVVATGIRLALLTIYAEVEGVMCSGPRRGKDLTYSSLADRAPQSQKMSRDEALGELALRYFRSHGPATIRDFAWWSGLTIADAKRAADITGARSEEIDRRTYWRIDQRRERSATKADVQLVPIYDEYLVAYRDRDAVPHQTKSFAYAVVSAGQVVGTWKPTRTPGNGELKVTPLRRFSDRERQSLKRAVERYQKFIAFPRRLLSPT